MEKKICLTCGKSVAQTEGKRERKYCNNTCKTTHWNKTAPKKKKKKASNMIDLPADYVNVDKIGILTADGKVLSIDQSAAEKEKFYKIWELAYISLEELLKDSQTAPNMVKIADLPKPKERVVVQNLAANGLKTNYSIDTTDKKLILEMIAEVKARKRPSYISGDKFEALRKIEIESLEKQLL